MRPVPRRARLNRAFPVTGNNRHRGTTLIDDVRMRWWSTLHQQTQCQNTLGMCCFHSGLDSIKPN